MFLRALALSALLAPTAHAADGATSQDLEYRDVQGDEDAGKRVVVKAQLESQWHELNNTDLRTLDESSDQAILDSDDRSSFAFSGISADITVHVDDDTRVVSGVSHRGLWGNDQLGSTNVFGGWVYFTALYFEHELSNGMKLRVGRQFFEPGANGGAREYILSDIVDMVRLDVPLGDKLSLTLIPINVIGSAQDPSDITLVQYIGQSNLETFGFRGDKMSRRYGLMLAADGLSDKIDARAYAFYTDIGALGSGSDISYNGRLGNFTDNDWLANFGLRGQVKLGSVTPFLSVDLSNGIDRQALVAPSVNTNGYAGTVGVALDTRDEDSGEGLSGELSGFMALGPSFTADGMQYSHGYVGMKARHTGGTLINRYLGWHPTSYVGMFGIDDRQNDYARKSGTMVGHADLAYDLGGGSIGLGWWYLRDTGVTALNQDNLDNIDPPFGYSREEFAAEARLGRALGQELDLDAAWQMTDAIDLTANVGAFLPGDFYAIPIGRIAGSALGGDAMAWTVNAGTRVRF